MIITCEECTTRFKLDDARIPAKGAKVRCSKCKHAFFVKPPTSAGDPVENAVSQAISADEADPQEASQSGTQRLDSQDAAGDSASPLRTPDDQSAQSAIDDYEESDWEFNTDEPDAFQPAPGLATEPDETTDLDLDGEGPSPEELDDPSSLALAGEGPSTEELDDPSSLALAGEGPSTEELDDPSSLDLAGDSVRFDEGETQPEAGPEMEPPSGVDAASEAVDDLLGGIDDDDEEFFDTSPAGVDHGIDALLDDGPEEAPPTPEPAPAPEVASAVADTSLDGLGLESETPSPPPPAAASRPSAPPREELGDPGEWDIFGEEAEAPRAAAPVAPQPVVIGRIGEKAAEARPPAQVDPDPSAANVWLRRAAQGVGWTAVTALAALVLYQALWLAPQAGPAQGASQQVAGLDARGLEGRWIENASGDWLYVVSGQLTGAGRPVRPGARLSLRLLDASGAPLVDEAADFGPALPMSTLRERSPEALRDGQSGAAASLAWQPIPPRSGVRVAAVVSEMPRQAARFELVAVPVGQPTQPPPVAEEADPADGTAPVPGEPPTAGSPPAPAV
jgi:predicted Zn finger-like uncharacterized protein